MADNSIVLIAFFGIFFGAAILLTVIVFGAKSRDEKRKKEHELEIARVSLEKERVRKQIVMIPCQYCGGVIPQSSTFCPNCGARRTS